MMIEKCDVTNSTGQLTHHRRKRKVERWGYPYTFLANEWL